MCLRATCTFVFHGVGYGLRNLLKKGVMAPRLALCGLGLLFSATGLSGWTFIETVNVILHGFDGGALDNALVRTLVKVGVVAVPSGYQETAEPEDKAPYRILTADSSGVEKKVDLTSLDNLPPVPRRSRVLEAAHVDAQKDEENDDTSEALVRMAKGLLQEDSE